MMSDIFLLDGRDAAQPYHDSVFWCAVFVHFGGARVAVGAIRKFRFQFFEQGDEFLMRYRMGRDAGTNILQPCRAQFELANHARLRDMRHVLERAVGFMMFAVRGCACEMRDNFSFHTILEINGDGSTMSRRCLSSGMVTEEKSEAFFVFSAICWSKSIL